MLGLGVVLVLIRLTYPITPSFSTPKLAYLLAAQTSVRLTIRIGQFTEWIGRYSICVSARIPIPSFLVTASVENIQRVGSPQNEKVGSPTQQNQPISIDRGRSSDQNPQVLH